MVVEFYVNEKIRQYQLLYSLNEHITHFVTLFLKKKLFVALLILVI